MGVPGEGQSMSKGLFCTQAGLGSVCNHISSKALGQLSGLWELGEQDTLLQEKLAQLLTPWPKQPILLPKRIADLPGLLQGVLAPLSRVSRACF